MFGRHGGGYVTTRARVNRADTRVGGMLAASTSSRQARLRLGDSSALDVGPSIELADHEWLVPWQPGRARGTRVRPPNDDESALDVPLMWYSRVDRTDPGSVKAKRPLQRNAEQASNPEDTTCDFIYP